MFTSQFQLPKNYQILKFINTCLSMKIKLIEVLLCRQIFEWWWQSWYFKLWELRILWNTFLIRLKWFHFQNPVSLSFCTSRENKNNFVNDVLSCSYLSRFFAWLLFLCSSSNKLMWFEWRFKMRDVSQKLIVAVGHIS